MSARGLVFAAPASGSGKTILVAALLRHLVRGGHDVRAAKLGPDYIDPAFHAAATGKSCVNIDLWAMRPATVESTLSLLTARPGLVIVEGVMGLFDAAADGRGSTADFAELSGWPVVLVVDARGQAASAGALLRGFATHRPGLSIAGVVFNRVGGESHAEMLQRAVDPLGIPVLGFVPRDACFARPERHLGLVQAGELDDLESFLDTAADRLARSVEVEALLNLAQIGPARSLSKPGAMIAPLGQRIAVASDAAFAFAYPVQLEAWRAAGAELSFFSPLADEAPAAGSDAVYLPGGYPELHACRLSGNGIFLDGLNNAATNGATIFGECGGYMVLGSFLVDEAGQRHAMAGLLPLKSSFAERRLHLGYREARLVGDGPLGPRGTLYRGHEFHYATATDEGEGEPLFEARDSRGEVLGLVGRRWGRVCGSFLHLIDLAESSVG
ncbi:MAG TPA: cobyrinate a,c-diamide synthase [Candidatus Udaeobacter sp.]|nr:cobyrinate a,c-diamide synthase [Candidatus Udaeobacter sp.]